MKGKETYFYNVVQPEDKLGRKLGLEDDKVATMFWKHEPSSGRYKVLRIDVLERMPNVEWDLDTLSNVMRHH